MTPRVITDTSAFTDGYEGLTDGDIVVGRLRLYPGEEHVLLDLAARGVTLIPSALSQLCSRSKVFQARILKRFMIPGTEAVYSMNDMLHVVSKYGRSNIGRVVCKLDRANGGLGVLLYPSIEDVYSQAALATLRFPFVVQPYIEQGRDVRVVVLGEYWEAYARHNPDNFRHNLHCGGTSTPLETDEAMCSLCRKILARADFPYACVDLLFDPSGQAWLNEINLRGGLRGAKITQNDYLQAVDRIHSDLAETRLR